MANFTSSLPCANPPILPGIREVFQPKHVTFATYIARRSHQHAIDYHTHTKQHIMEDCQKRIEGLNPIFSTSNIRKTRWNCEVRCFCTGTKWEPLAQNFPKHPQNTHKQAKYEEARLTHFILSFVGFYDKISFVPRIPGSIALNPYIHLTNHTRNTCTLQKSTTTWKTTFFKYYHTEQSTNLMLQVMWVARCGYFWHSFISG